LLFHGIGTDVTRLVSILQHGILSPQEATKKGRAQARNYDHGYNLDNEVSATQSPVKINRRRQGRTHVHSALV
jgi:hypothetical protein